MRCQIIITPTLTRSSTSKDGSCVENYNKHYNQKEISLTINLITNGPTIQALEVMSLEVTHNQVGASTFFTEIVFVEEGEQQLTSR